jgi:hypothetical protein
MVVVPAPTACARSVLLVRAAVHVVAVVAGSGGGQRRRGPPPLKSEKQQERASRWVSALHGRSCADVTVLVAAVRSFSRSCSRCVETVAFRGGVADKSGQQNDESS